MYQCNWDDQHAVNYDNDMDTFIDVAKAER